MMTIDGCMTVVNIALKAVGAGEMGVGGYGQPTMFRGRSRRFPLAVGMLAAGIEIAVKVLLWSSGCLE